MQVQFKQNGNIEVSGKAIGTWHHRDIWAENGGSHDRSGNKLVHHIWEGKLNDGRILTEYTREDLRKEVSKSYNN